MATIKSLFEYLYLLPIQLYIEIEYLYMSSYIKKHGWTNADYGTCIDPDMWMHPNSEKNKTLYGAYHLTKLNPINYPVLKR